jgi:hypothetical protein
MTIDNYSNGGRSGRCWMAALFVLVGVTAGDLVAQEPTGDYGDAPDGSETYYPQMFSTTSNRGEFPTQYGTAFSRIGQPGAHHLTTGEEWLGRQPGPVSDEAGASDASDPDGQTNLVNSDHWEDAFPRIPFWMDLFSIPPMTSISFYVSASASAPAGNRYVNVLIDWNQDGSWENIPGGTPEWVVQDHQVFLNPGETKLESSTQFPWGWGAMLSPQVFWVRITITRQPIGASGYNYVDSNGCWDGSGAFQYGETEDFFFNPYTPLVQKEGGPWSPPGQGNTPNEEKKRKVNARLKIVPRHQSIFHTQTAIIDVVKVPSNYMSPEELAGQSVSVKKWFIQGVPGGDPATGDLDPSVSHTTSSGSIVGVHSPALGGLGAPPGAVATITVSPLGHDYPNTEQIPVSIRVDWPGVITETKDAMVFVRHSNHLFGPFGMDAAFDNLGRKIATSPLSYPTRSAMGAELAGAYEDFINGGFSDALAHLGDLQVLVNNNQVALQEEVRDPGGFNVDSFFDITYQIDGLEDGLDDLISSPLPSITFEFPDPLAHISGSSYSLGAECDYPDTEYINFQWWDAEANGGVGEWTSENLSDSFVWTVDGEASVTVDTTQFSDGAYLFRAFPGSTEPGYPVVLPHEGSAQLLLTIDNTPPDSELPVAVTAPSQLIGEGFVTLTGIPESLSGEVMARVELLIDDFEGGDNAYTIGLTWDFGDEENPDDDSDPVEVYVNTLNIPMLGIEPYVIRCSLEDKAGNVTSYASTETVDVLPSYMAWKFGYFFDDFLSRKEDDNSDGDDLPLILEYALGYDPTTADSVGAKIPFSISSSEGGMLNLSSWHVPQISGIECSIYSSDSPDGDFEYHDAMPSEFMGDMNNDMEIDPSDFPSGKQFFQQMFEDR